MDDNIVKVRLPHGEWVNVRRTEGFSTEGGKGILLNEPLADCYIHHGSEITFVVKDDREGEDYYEWDWQADVPPEVIAAAAKKNGLAQ